MATRIKDGMIPYTGGIGIEITNNHVINVLLRELNNLIQVNGDRELYVDLQLPSGIKPTDTFPVGVTTGKILQADGRQQSGLILNWKTTSGDYNRLIYANDGKLYIDKGTGQREELGGCDCVPYTGGEGIEVLDGTDYSAMRGPCDTGFHIPTKGEWNTIFEIGRTLGAFGVNSRQAGQTYLKLPSARYRDASDGHLVTSGAVGSVAKVWTCTGDYMPDVYIYQSTSVGAMPHVFAFQQEERGYAYNIRAFKDIPAIPDSSWTKLYDGSSVVDGAGIFHNATLGLISLSQDGIEWITMQDKNVGATQIWNRGDTVNENNSGKYYQRGNNYGFPAYGSTDTITTSSTPVDASTYGPGNYYSSSTFITYQNDNNRYIWDTSNNLNLRGGITGPITRHNVINNTGVLSVNGLTGHVTSALVDSIEPSTPQIGMLRYDTTNSVLKIYDGANRQTI